MGEHSSRSPRGDSGASLVLFSDEAPRSLGAKATSGMGWSLVNRFGSQLLASLVFIVLAREVSPKAFGIIALANVFVAFANVFLGTTASQGLIAQRTLRRDHLDTAFWLNTGITVVIAGSGAVFAPFYARTQHNGDVRLVLQLLCLDMLVGSVGAVPSTLVTRELMFRKMSIRILSANVIADIVGVALALGGAGVYALVAQTMVYTLISAVAMYFIVPYRPGFAVTRRALQDLRSFGVNVTVLNVFSLANRQGDNFLIGTYLGAVKLGFYSIAYQVLNIFEDALVNTTQGVMFPVFASVTNDRTRLLRAYELASRATAVIAFPAFVGLSLVSGQMIPLIFGEKWHSAVPVAEVLAFIGIVHTVTQFNGQVCKAVNKTGLVVRFSLFNTIVNVTGFFITVHYGIFWVAVSYVARGWILYPLSVTMVRKAIHHDVPHHLRGFVAPGLATGAMSAAVLLFESHSHGLPAWPRLILCVLVGAVVYPAVLLPLAGREIRAIVEALRVARQSGPKRKGGGKRAALAAQLAAEGAGASGDGTGDAAVSADAFAADNWEPPEASSPLPMFNRLEEQEALVERLQVLATGGAGGTGAPRTPGKDLPPELRALSRPTPRRSGKRIPARTVPGAGAPDAPAPRTTTPSSTDRH